MKRRPGRISRPGACSGHESKQPGQEQGQTGEDSEQDKNGRYIRRERYAGTCSRSFYVGDVQPSEIGAKYEDGILKLSVPKADKRRLPEKTTIAIE